MITIFPLRLNTQGKPWSFLERKNPAFSMFSYVFNDNKIEFEPQNMITIFPLRLNTQLFTRQIIA